MPNNNQSANNQNDDTQPVFGLDDSMPPVTHDEINHDIVHTQTQPTPAPIDDIDNPSPSDNMAQEPVTEDFNTETSSGSAAPADDILTQASEPDQPRKKYPGSRGKIIATILGLFLLVGGAVAGLRLVRQNQNVQEKANCGECTSNSQCGGGSIVCRNGCCVQGVTCSPGEQRACSVAGCNGQETCSSSGTWGSCQKSDPDCGSTCSSGQTRCASSTQVQVCVAGNWQNPSSCTYGCANGSCNPALTACPLGGLDCSLTSVTGAFKCSNNGATAWCCNSGYKNVNGACAPTTTTTINCGGVQCKPDECHCQGGDACTSLRCEPNIKTACTGSGRSWCINTVGTYAGGYTCCVEGYVCGANNRGCVPKPTTPPAPVPTRTPTPAPTPKGNHGGIDCTKTWGWACDASNYATPLTIHFYKDGPYNGGGTLIGSTVANGARESAVAQACGGNPNHGFTFNIPASLKDGRQHSVYAYAINVGGGSGNPLLLGSPRTFTCATPTPRPTPTAPPVAQCLNVKAFNTSWVQLTAQQLAQLKPGNKVRFTVAGQASVGSFTKARFTINGNTRSEVTVKRPNTNEFYDEYTIPNDGTTSFSITAQIFHQTLGWR